MKNFFKERKLLIVLIIVIITILVAIIAISCKKVKFEVEDFSISEETTDYDFTDNYTTYNGEGTITTKDEKGVYLVVVKKELTSGGSKDMEKEETFTCIVSNGEGEFTTYDISMEENPKKPKYKFEIIGYQKMK